MRLACSIFFFVLLSCGNASKVNSDRSIEDSSLDTATVSVYVVKQGVFKQDVLSNGKVFCFNKADLQTPLKQNIVKIYVKNGQEVKAGQIIAEFDNFEQKNKLILGALNFEKSKNILQDILIGLGYAYKDSNAIPKQILEISKIKSGFSAAENDLMVLRFALQQTKLVAPISGKIANLFLKENNFTRSGEIFCSILNYNKIEVQFPILEKEMEQVRTGGFVNISPYFNESVVQQGSISEINPSIDKNGLFLVKALFQQQGDVFVEGMNVRIAVQVPVKSGFSIPKEGVLTRDGKEVVFVCRRNMAHWVYVKTLEESEKYFLVKSGISVGDSIIVTNNATLVDGANVKPVLSKNAYND